mgnify:CR=1 FL=1
MKKTKWAAMAAAMLFLVSAYLGTSPALARYLNSEQYFTTHAAENRSLTVEVGQTGAGNFLTSDGAAFLVTGAQNSTLPFTFTNDGSDAKVIRITSTTALGSSADEVFILNPSKSEDPAQTVTDPVVSGTVSKYEKSHTIDGTLAAGIYTVSIEVFEARDVKLTGAKDDTTDPTTPENPDSSGDSENSGGNTGDNTGDNTDSGETGDNSGSTEATETENTPAAQSAAPAVPTPTAEMTENEENSESEKNGDNSGSGEDGTTPTTPSNPITPAGDSNSSIEEGSAKPYITLRAVFVVQIDGSAPPVTVAPLLTITGNKHSINGTNQLSVVADAAVSDFAYSVQRYVELEQDAKNDGGEDIKVKVLQWQTIELTVPEEGTTEIPAIKGFTAELNGNTLTLTNAESQAPAGLYRLVIDLKDTKGFPLYVPFLVNYRQPVLQDAQEETPTVVI